MNHATVFAAVFACLYAAHQFGDHWIQQSAEACGKGAPTWRGRFLCARHVATLAATKVTAIVVTAAALHLPLSIPAVAAALGIDAVTHYFADRRAPLARFAEWLGKGELWRLGDGKAAPCGTGAYSLDQSWHIIWLWITALIVAAWS